MFYNFSIYLIVWRARPGVATLTLNRPRARNALSLGLLQRLRCVLSHWAALPVAVAESPAVADEDAVSGAGAGAAAAAAAFVNGSVGDAGMGTDRQQQQMVMTNETAAQFLARVVGASSSSSSLTSHGVRPRVIVLRGNGPVFSSGHDLKVRARVSECVCADFSSALVIYVCLLRIFSYF